jgi:tol-pal system protein YbgF
MSRFTSGALAALATAMLIANSAAAQEADQSGFGFLDRLFAESPAATPSVPAPRSPAAPGDRIAQAGGPDLPLRIDRLEAQIRQLTGVVEQLQYRNQQLENQLRRLQEDADAKTGAPAQTRSLAPAVAPGLARPPAGPPVAAPAPPPGRRGDAFDPNQNPSAPGAPRTLGALPQGGEPPLVPPGPTDDIRLGAPGGRAAGAPLDLTTLAATDQNPVDPQTRSANAAPQLATAPPSESAKDYYDLGYGYMLRKDYALAEESLRGFLRRFPSDRLAADAQYWLGESLFQRQRYRDAAEAFLNVSTKYESTAKAPEALLRLGQSLAALGEKEAACASLGEISRKYPRASAGVKQNVEREQKRVHC